MSTRVLFLPPGEQGDALLVQPGDDGHGMSCQHLAPGLAAPAAPVPGRTVVVVPGGPVRIDRLHLRAHSDVQALAAARALVAERLARPAELHVAVDRHGDSPCRVAAVEAAVMRGWLARVDAFGLRADAMVPEPLLVPEPADPGVVHVVEVADRWIVHGDGLAFSAPGELARRVLGQRPLIHLEGGLERLAAAALQPPLDLLQGDFAPGPAAGHRSWRRVAWLAAALAISPLLLVAGQTMRLELAARSLEAGTATLLASALPGAGEGATPTEPLQALHAPRRFAAASGSLFAAVSARPGIHLVELEYAAGDGLRAVLFHRDAADIEAVRAALAVDGWRLVEGGSTGVAGGLHTGLAMEASP